MKKTGFKITVIAILLGFLLMITPYIRPKSLTFEQKEVIDKKLSDLEYKGEQVYLVSDPNEAFQVRLAMIQNAKERIVLSSYIIHEGDTTTAIYSELIKAADRGVKVTLLTDYKLGGTRNKTGKALASHPNINSYTYNPLSLFKIRSWQSVHHEKYLVVDGDYALVGGRNIGDKYFTKTKDLKTVSDLDVLVISEHGFANALHDYANNFIGNSEIKQINTKQKRAYEKQKNIWRKQLNSSYSLDNYILKAGTADLTFLTNPMIPTETQGYIGYALTQLAANTNDKVVVQTPYATAHKDSLRILKDLTDQGVSVQFLTNSIASSANYPAFSNYYKNKEKFLKTKIDIYEYQSDGGHSIHTKAYQFDDILVIGSFNLDDRSFFVNTEMVLIVRSDALNKQYNDVIHEQLEQSFALSGDKSIAGKDQEVHVSWFKRFMMTVSSVFSRIFSFLI
ncbi:phosphatidylserine/phosphatidylglycerophosphate/ cardiolipin synthase family protein [Erysipelothrix urinaevulpis]|uniref:phospholipase D-like domain-containing protein n=1 Tax=Erysipelothrix urinaevulpis TaxID=2683717 RepID=UPI00135ADF9B|nr:phosphatidylserine/phosphatidylglycerophosphate/cardiolipin synthase family protein [Erysipelothrix urinaevulpis]